MHEKGGFTRTNPFLVRLISQESIVHMDNSTPLHELVNRAAFTRYQNAQKRSKFRTSLQETLRQGEKEAIQAAKDLRARGYIPQDVKIHYRASPQGYGVFRKRIARSEATERSAVEIPSEATNSGCQKEGSKEPLVNHANNCSHFLESIDQKTGEIHRLTRNECTSEICVAFDPVFNLTEKYRLQSVARDLLKGHTVDNGKIGHHPVYKVVNCHRVPISSAVNVLADYERTRANYGGLQTCGSVWHCPVCAARIAERRAQEVRFMTEMWQNTGGGVLFATLTIRHNHGDDLRILYDLAYRQAWYNFSRHRSFIKAKKQYGFKWYIRAFEVTHGANGWHPHLHLILFVERSLTSTERKAFEHSIFKAWNASITGMGLPSVSRSRGITLQDGSRAADYLAKFGRMPRWDNAKEMTKAHMKNGHSSSHTPFQLLQRASQGDFYAGKLFQEYAIAMHDKRQLTYSQGLREFFQVEDVTDERIAANMALETVVLAQLTREEWRRVTVHGDRAALLMIALNGGLSAVQLYLNGLS